MEASSAYRQSETALPPRSGSGFVAFLDNHKGDLTLAASFVLYLSSWAIVREWSIAGQLAKSMGEAALVGGLCDYIALKMIFERRWYLPNSGVLPRNREKLIDGIANTIETQWLTPKMIGDKLHQLDLVRRLGRFLEDLSLEDALSNPNLKRICERTAQYIDSPSFVFFIEDKLRAEATRTVRFARAIGLVNYTDLSRKIVTRLHQMVADLPHNTELMKTLEQRVHHLGEELQQRDSPVRDTAYRMIDLLVEHAINASRGEIARTVRENLCRLSDDEIRIQIESRTRKHLDWIRVNGGLFGAIFGAAFGTLNFLVEHSAVIMQFIR
jgi:uncharacterized membrane-anchored protein YjiN (DUF445 family)